LTSGLKRYDIPSSSSTSRREFIVKFEDILLAHWHGTLVALRKKTYLNVTLAELKIPN